MKTFKQHLEERKEISPQMARIMFAEFMGKDFYIPFTEGFIRKLLKTPIQVNAGHILERRNIDVLFNLEGKSNSISALSNPLMTENIFRSFMTTGVATGGGVFALVSGNVLLNAPADIFSMRDGNGTRWVSAGHIITSNKNHTVSGSRLKDFRLVRKVLEKIGQARLDYLERKADDIIDTHLGGDEAAPRSILRLIQNWEWDYDHEIVRSIVAEYTIFMSKLVEKIVSRYRKEFTTVLFFNNINHDHLNELLLSRIKVHEIWFSDQLGNSPEIADVAVDLRNRHGVSVKFGEQEAYKAYIEWIKK